MRVLLALQRWGHLRILESLAPTELNYLISYHRKRKKFYLVSSKHVTKPKEH